jgi:hypothetical protein
MMDRAPPPASLFVTEPLSDWPRQARPEQCCCAAPFGGQSSRSGPAVRRRDRNFKSRAPRAHFRPPDAIATTQRCKRKRLLAGSVRQGVWPAPSLGNSPVRRWQTMRRRHPPPGGNNKRRSEQSGQIALCKHNRACSLAGRVVCAKPKTSGGESVAALVVVRPALPVIACLVRRSSALLAPALLQARLQPPPPPASLQARSNRFGANWLNSAN